MAVYLKAHAELKVLTLSTEKPCRWLSFDALVKAVYADYLALIHTLNNLKDGDAASLDLFTKVKDVKFIGAVYILSVVLPHLSTISKALQKGTVDFSQIAPTIEYAKGQLDDAVKTKCPINRLKVDLEGDGRLGLLDMNASEHQYQG